MLIDSALQGCCVVCATVTLSAQRVHIDPRAHRRQCRDIAWSIFAIALKCLFMMMKSDAFFTTIGTNLNSHAEACFDVAWCVHEIVVAGDLFNACSESPHAFADYLFQRDLGTKILNVAKLDSR